MEELCVCHQWSSTIWESRKDGKNSYGISVAGHDVFEWYGELDLSWPYHTASWHHGVRIHGPLLPQDEADVKHISIVLFHSGIGTAMLLPLLLWSMEWPIRKEQVDRSIPVSSWCSFDPGLWWRQGTGWLTLEAEHLKRNIADNARM